MPSAVDCADIEATELEALAVTKAVEVPLTRVTVSVLVALPFSDVEELTVSRDWVEVVEVDDDAGVVEEVDEEAEVVKELIVSTAWVEVVEELVTAALRVEVVVVMVIVTVADEVEVTVEFVLHVGVVHDLDDSRDFSHCSSAGLRETIVNLRVRSRDTGVRDGAGSRGDRDGTIDDTSDGTG